jgi:hypothetical protein
MQVPPYEVIRRRDLGLPSSQTLPRAREPRHWKNSTTEGQVKKSPGRRLTGAEVSGKVTCCAQSRREVKPNSVIRYGHPSLSCRL